MVLIADNCALPALARQLQAMPADAHAQVLALVEDESEIRPCHCLRGIRCAGCAQAMQRPQP
jgi:NADPH-dependent ferric siderophore reductase